MTEISVVIPSYNHAAYIGEAVESVLGQTVHDLELIIIDDGSTDHSLEVLSKYSDPRMRVISQTNRGAHAAINRGLGEASGDYLAILNSDDTYHPQRLENAISALRANPEAGFAGSYIQIIDNEGKPLGVKHGYQDCPPWLLESPELSFRAGTDLGAALLTENYWSTTSNFIFSRDTYQTVGEFRPLRYTHDWDYALRVSNITSPILLTEPLVQYRIHASNTIRENQVAMIFEICWCLAVHLPQYVTDKRFYDQFSTQDRIDQLLHSIYTFGMDRVLSVMLLQQLQNNQEFALELLNPDNPTRAQYLDFINKHLSQENKESTSEQVEAEPLFAKTNLAKLINRFKSIPKR
ncbi:MAG: glycosyltransferase [Anaerolineales bacterium]|nr:glycosyltransferase [Anaerolineales bacterium]